ncbi:MAG: patatin-like phospholipase family protein [Treponema sp.]|jgi:NTE family protein|nr:patatin-like phospholipase family protein [Treponema sp.]
MFWKALPVSAVCLALALQTPPALGAGRPSVALVLAGGGAKGYAHIPVLELIEELDIPIDMVIGTSAGAIIGGLYCAGYSPQMMKDIFLDLDWNVIFQDRPVFPFERRLGTHSFERNPLGLAFSRTFALNLGRGFSSGQEAYKLFRSLTAKIPSYISFDSLPVPFRATAVELTTGKLEFFSSGDLAEAIRASMSIPAVFEPFSIDGKYYLDGGVLDNLPVRQAKALGFDIVIAVELLNKMLLEPDAFNSSPLAALNQTLSIYLHAGAEAKYADADAVLFPDVERYAILDFPKAREIYEQAEGQKAAFRETLLKLRKKIYGDAERVPPAAKGDRYSALPYITLENLSMSGALTMDEKYIRRRFDQTLSGRSATRERLEAFIGEVYRTGHYTFAVARLDAREGAPLLELRLFRSDLRNAYAVFGAGFQETLSSDVLVKLQVFMGAQFRGLTGPGSALALGFTGPYVLTFQGLFFQPLGQKFFFSTGIALTEDQERITPGFVSGDQRGSSILSARAAAGLGWQIDSANTLAFDFSWFSGTYIDGVTGYFTFAHNADSGLRAGTLGLALGWEYNTLNAPMFASRGLLFNLGNTVIFPLKGGAVSDMVQADFALALPLAKKAGIIFNAFAGGDVTGNLGDLPGHTALLGYSSADRVFFPQVAGRQRFGAAKAAASLAVQAEPFKNTTIMGAEWFFALAAASGVVFDDAAALSPQALYWNASFNIGVRFTRSFGAIYRMGWGRGEYAKPLPFFSFDVGCLRW